jgi:hypothetical protein
MVRFDKRWGVPEGFLEPDSGWDVGGYHGELWEKHYRCDRGGDDLWCQLERAYAVGKYLPDAGRSEEICRLHIRRMTVRRSRPMPTPPSGRSARQASECVQTTVTSA